MGKGEGKGGLLESESLAKMICLVCYVAYMVLGLIMMIVGVLFYTEMGTEHAYISLGLGVCGFFMMILGGTALFAIWKLLWIVLASAQAGNFFILFIMLIGSFAGVFLGMDIRDPVRAAVDNTWDDPVQGVQWKASFFDTCVSRCIARDTRGLVLCLHLGSIDASHAVSSCPCPLRLFKAMIVCW